MGKQMCKDILIYAIQNISLSPQLIYLSVYLTPPTSEYELNPSETLIKRIKSSCLLLQCCQY